MDPRIPFIVFGDGPRLPSGLARIARDLTVRLVAHQEALGIRVVQVGVDYGEGWHFQPWDFYGFQATFKDMGFTALAQACWDLAQEHDARPIVLAINDPSRVYDLIRDHSGDPAYDKIPGLDAEMWGYLPIDGENLLGKIGGPAGATVARLDRVLAYGRYGAQILKKTRGTPIPFLPHGLEPGIWRPGIPVQPDDQAFSKWLDGYQGFVVGAVATNQPRKDLGLLFETVAIMRERLGGIRLWLHTDRMTNVWDVGQLVTDTGLSREEVFASCNNLPDRVLAGRYCRSNVSIAPGLGEGFGYPIVESLACGTPVIHGDYAGGAELIPRPDWLIEPLGWRLESAYALKRPVFLPEAFALAAIRACLWSDALGPVAREYCAGAVAHLSWEHLWSRWYSWVQQGLHERRAAA